MPSLLWGWVILTGYVTLSPRTTPKHSCPECCAAKFVQPELFLSFSLVHSTHTWQIPNCPWKLLNLPYGFTSLQGAGLAHSGILSQINHSHDSSGYFAIRKALLLSIPGSVLSPILGLSLKQCWEPLPIRAERPLCSMHKLLVSDKEHHCSESHMVLNRNSSAKLSPSCQYSVSHYTPIGQDLKELMSLSAALLWHSCQQPAFLKDVRNVRSRVTLKTPRELPPVFLPIVSTKQTRCSCAYSNGR